MLTDKQLQFLQPAPTGQRRIVWDQPAGRGYGRLGIRVSAKAATFIYMYSRRGKPRMTSLGRYPTLSLADARVKAATFAAAVKAGRDPAVALIEERQRQHEMPTVAELADEYIKRWARRRKKTWEQDRRMLDRDVLPAWGDWAADEVRRRDVRALLDGIASRAPIQANRVLALLRKMWNFAVEEEILQANPCWQVRRPTRERSRDRVLTAAEIRALWRVLDRDPGDGRQPALGMWPSRPIRLALRLALVTAQRRREITATRWAEIDLADGWWTIPRTTTKNKLSHRVPLSELALEIIREIQEYTGSSAFLLPSPRRGSVQPHALSTAVSRVRSIAGIPHWRGHDLRRTAASGMASTGVSRLVIGQVLNHVEAGVTAVYDRYGYDQEKRVALDQWAIRLREIVERT